ncbi:glutamine-hydrolyzing asparagine synthase [Coccomyxa subellipsoidea C-169]|uniref:Asparagine synthetase [glutamine-hydrolyzing] n=1 Tax=Coccomyxa subellipsoidea (strain C-169) TaxID=574566 RepID=I0ZAN1_COCSC|nr:glutamine-hydrolyzing asparagine synthase [Coccomyxa subellipsoidea C-169]EIE27700.1 glutamine-hydrolyzing asparagine synthase [Coccomyxa subellipsoidea C-169]|eukprot:XP_005652244.1 glutamine-hydrolyzing asparagine synthase [Coccomyxa subellipsoidea C-169]
MCGILAALGLQGDPEKNRRMMLRQSKLLRHRGPDANSIWQSTDGNSFIAFERLQIIDVTDGGKQPFIIERPGGNIAWALNSEIYNHDELKQKYLKGVKIVKDSKSDSAIIGHMYEKLGDSDELWNSLDGIFACVLVDEATGDFVAARDPIGVCSFYWGKGRDGSTWFASEMKALQAHCETFDIFPPGHCYRSRTGKLERWYKPKWLDLEYVPTAPADLTTIHDSLVGAVVKRLMSDAPLGVLLSGGLDSSLVAAIAVRHMKESKNAYDTDQPLHTFSIGLPGSPDLVAARRVAAFLGTQHHEFTFTVEEGIDALYDLIWHIESYEQVRASVPMYILSRKIKAGGFKVVLSGEGADEIYGGYLFFHKAPTPKDFQQETVRLVRRLHQFDVMRANKAPFSFGLEPRVPFLDKAFLDTSMTLDPADKMDKPDGKHARMEKYLLRKAFDRPEDPYLPEDVLWRQKEQFSDGVGYNWVDGLKEYAEKVVTDELWEARQVRFPEHTPNTREYYLLRSMFEEHFPSPSALATVPKGLSIACSTPEALAWDPEWADTHEISGRAMQAVHAAGSTFTYQKRQPSGGDPGPAGPAAAAAPAERPIANGKIVPQTSPLPACSRLDVPKGVAQAAKANGIHVAAG